MKRIKTKGISDSRCGSFKETNILHNTREYEEGKLVFEKDVSNLSAKEIYDIEAKYEGTGIVLDNKHGKVILKVYR